MYACEYLVERATKRDSWLANGITNRVPKHLEKCAMVFGAKVFGSMMEILAHDLRVSCESPNVTYLLGPLAGRRGYLPSRNDVLLRKQFTHPVMDYTCFSCSLVPAVLSEIRRCFRHNVRLKCTLAQALRLCTGRTAHRWSRGMALLFHDRGSRRG